MEKPMPLEALFDGSQGNALPLPAELRDFFGPLRFPLHASRPYLIGNFVTTLDGVVDLNVADHQGGGDISGFNEPDHAIMGILRAVADAIIVGSETLHTAPGHIWTAEYIYPPFAEAYRALRHALGRLEPPLNVFVSAEGHINLHQPVFQSGQVPTLVITTTEGEQRLHAQQPPSSVQIKAVQAEGRISATTLLETVHRARQSEIILCEGGPQLMAHLFAESRLDELFLTLAPQVAGRDASTERPGLVSGISFAPEHPRWGQVIGVKRAASHLFLRYTFATSERRDVL